MSWRMPPETAAHECTWMAFPRAGHTLGSGEAADAGYAAWAAVANTVAQFEPVRMVVDPSERARAERMVAGEVELIEAPLDDFWMRDIGPTFVLDPDRPGTLGAVDWVFNAWGAPAYASWQRDREIARFIATEVGAELISSLLVNEGGAIHVDGEGTVLATTTVQLDPGRNPYADATRIEAEFERTLGGRRTIWFPCGLTRDNEELGTRGHIDMVATIPSPGRLLLHTQLDPRHPDFEVTMRLRAFIDEQTDASGRPFEVIELPAPATLRDQHGWVDYSYVNHYVLNGAVIACGYGEPDADERAANILSSAYPGRTVVTVDAREMLVRGGGIHCITQQQPKVLA
ncbi:MAG TPA: agmatine deiminase family protein [Candidatus Lumbricidophila sp.]|nr:agmatine deiminase family protein [Candidatus Lumbricidophila sp.]